MAALGDIIAVSNYATLAFLMAIGMLACARIGLNDGLKPKSHQLLIGVFLLCTWGLFDQIYRIFLRYLFVTKDPFIEVLTDNGWLQMVLYVVAFTGAIYVANALFRSRCLLVSKAKDVSPQIEGWTIWAVLIVIMWVAMFIITKSLVG